MPCAELQIHKYFCSVRESPLDASVSKNRTTRVNIILKYLCGGRCECSPQPAPSKLRSSYDKNAEIKFDSDAVQIFHTSH
jgi:hypothetical protein